LILAARDPERLALTAENCKKNGRVIETFVQDFTDCENLAANLKTFIAEKELSVDAFAHFAGMTEVLPMSKSNYRVGLEVMQVNYFSATEIISTLLKRRVNGMALQRILLIGSIVALNGKKYQPHYASSKAAILGLTRTLAYELAPRVRVNAISPGSFPTRITKTIFADETSEWAPPTLLPPGDIDDLSKVAQFLLSEDAHYLTGQISAVDGGESILRL
jgi:NAD(P)-dependent dehydrogenase (short-subunit alcohol dehydrogenase family)